MSDFSITLDTATLTRFASVLEKAPQQTITEVTKAVNDAAIAIRNKARSYAPHQHGTLQNSIHATPATVMANNVKATVGTNLDYAPYQEYGTGIYGPNPHMIEILPTNKKALYWPGAAHPVRRVLNPGVKPKAYMQKAFDDGDKILNDNVGAALDRVINFLATA